MKRIGILIIGLIIFIPSAVFPQEAVDYGKATAVIVGVLSWKDAKLASFSSVRRKDAELYSALIARGMPQKNATLLLDGRATQSAVYSVLLRRAMESASDSVFIFYYAGHGIREKERVYFANYDVDSKNAAKTGISLTDVADIIAKNFKGRMVIFLADCCYSGELRNAAKTVSAKGIMAISLTSAEASNSSTGNWTFTQSIIDCMNGSFLADGNADGVITLGETAAETREAMKYRERQRNGFSVWNCADTLVLAKAEAHGESQSLGNGFALGEYVLAGDEGKEETARITSLAASAASCEFYHYTDKMTRTLPYTAIKKISFKEYPAGKEVTVVWGESFYKAKILKVENGFHLITYTGWPSFWDEWVMDNRIVEGDTADGKNVYVEWKGSYYPATILKKEKGKYLIHYAGFDASWDEWVEPKRVKFK